MKSELVNKIPGLLELAKRSGGIHITRNPAGQFHIFDKDKYGKGEICISITRDEHQDQTEIQKFRVTILNFNKGFSYLGFEVTKESAILIDIDGDLNEKEIESAIDTARRGLQLFNAFKREMKTERWDNKIVDYLNSKSANDGKHEANLELFTSVLNRVSLEEVVLNHE